MQIDPRHLVQFAAIVEEGSFSVAAQKLGTTQPARSNMVKNLETRTGLKLLAQRRRPVIPTSEGRSFAIKGQGVRSLIEEAERESDEARQGNAGLIRVGALSFFCEQVLAELIATFRSQKPKASFDVTTGYNLELHTLVERRAVDVAFGPILLDIDQARTHLRTIVNFRHAIVCRSDNPILKIRSISADDLQGADWISPSPDSTLYQVMQAEMSRLGVTSLGNAIRSNSASALMNLLQSTDCLSVMPVFAVLPALRSGRLSVIDIGHRLPEVPFGVITQPRAAPAPLVARFIDHVEQGLMDIQTRAAAFGS